MTPSKQFLITNSLPFFGGTSFNMALRLALFHMLAVCSGSRDAGKRTGMLPRYTWDQEGQGTDGTEPGEGCEKQPERSQQVHLSEVTEQGVCTPDKRGGRTGFNKHGEA